MTCSVLNLQVNVMCFSVESAGKCDVVLVLNLQVHTVFKRINRRNSRQLFQLDVHLKLFLEKYDTMAYQTIHIV